MSLADGFQKKKNSPLPTWVIPAAFIVLIGIILFLVFSPPTTTPIPAGSNSLTDNQNSGNTGQVPNTGEDANPPAETHTTVNLPGGVFEVTVIPSDPFAGSPVSVTAKILPFFQNGWEDQFSYEIWMRQFGNWVKTPCDDIVCTATWNTPATGDLEYAIKRFNSDGTLSTEVGGGSGFITVKSTTNLSDTLPPKATISIDPVNPKVGDEITFSAFADDYSKVASMKIIVDGASVKECTPNAKIAQCLVKLSTLEAGPHVYSVQSVDGLGNAGSSIDQNVTVSP